MKDCWAFPASNFPFSLRCYAMSLVGALTQTLKAHVLLWSVDEHADQGEKHIRLNPDQPPPPQIIQIERTLQTK